MLWCTVACLAHDLGNPPFGHTGEDALRDWFRRPEHQIYLNTLNEAERNDIQTYEGNAHSLRIVASLEMYPEAGGMRLTAAAIGALLKYPWTTQHPNRQKKIQYLSNRVAVYPSSCRRIGAGFRRSRQLGASSLSYLMEAADDICYALLDLEDAVELDLLTDTEVESIFVRADLCRKRVARQLQSSALRHVARHCDRQGN